MAVDSAGNVFVADSANNAIRKITPCGVVTTFAGDPTAYAGGGGSLDGTSNAARFSEPEGLTFDSSNILYVADSNNHTIRKITPAAVVTTIAGMAQQNGTADGTNSDARFALTTGVAVDQQGNLYVAEYPDINLRKITPMGTNWVVTTITQVFSPGDYTYLPDSVAVDGAGNIYRGNDYFNVITVLDSGGNPATWYGGDNQTSQQQNDPFSDPDSLAVDGAGNLFVANRGGCTILMIPADTLGGTAVAGFLAGKWQSADGAGGGTDGTGTDALFNSPRGMTVDGAGNLYVTDTGNNTIRKGFPTSSLAPVVLQLPSLTAGQFGFAITGLRGLTVIVDGSSDLYNWQAVSTNVLTGATSSFSVTPPSQTCQFYRVRVP